MSRCTADQSSEDLPRHLQCSSGVGSCCKDPECAVNARRGLTTRHDIGGNEMGTKSSLGTLQPDCYVLGFQEIDQTQVAVVGGKGAHLGELSRIEGIRVPAGFCVTTDAFRTTVADAPSIGERLDRISRVK